jgi:hypothetical protein
LRDANFEQQTVALNDVANFLSVNWLCLIMKLKF